MATYSAPTTITTGQLVTASLMNTDWGGNIAFLANPPTCRVYNTSAISLATGSYTTLTFNSERWDPTSMHSTVSNPSRITISTAGVYIIEGHVQFDTNTTSERILEFLVNGTNEIAFQRLASNGTGGSSIYSLVTVWKFAAADYVELRAYQATGGAQNTGTSNSSTNAGGLDFGATWIGLG